MYFSKLRINCKKCQPFHVNKQHIIRGSSWRAISNINTLQSTSLATVRWTRSHVVRPWVRIGLAYMLTLYGMLQYSIGETITHFVLKTATASYRGLRRSKNYLCLVRLLQACIEQNHHVLQVLRMAGV